MPVCAVGCVPVRGVSVCVCVHGIARGAESRRRHWGRAGPPPGSGHPGVPAHTAPRHRPPPWCRLTSEYDYESGEWMRRRSVGASLGGFSHLSLAALPGRRRGIAPGRRGSRSIRHRVFGNTPRRERIFYDDYASVALETGEISVLTTAPPIITVYRRVVKPSPTIVRSNSVISRTPIPLDNPYGK